MIQPQVIQPQVSRPMVSQPQVAQPQVGQTQFSQSQYVQQPMITQPSIPGVQPVQEGLRDELQYQKYLEESQGKVGYRRGSYKKRR